MEIHNNDKDALVEARRRFLATCGKFAVATPPAVALLLAASKRSYAQFASGAQGDSDGDNDGD